LVFDTGGIPAVLTQHKTKPDEKHASSLAPPSSTATTASSSSSSSSPASSGDMESPRGSSSSAAQATGGSASSASGGGGKQPVVTWPALEQLDISHNPELYQYDGLLALRDTLTTLRCANNAILKMPKAIIRSALLSQPLLCAACLLMQFVWHVSCL
jgi:hypothetical protein